MRDPEQTRPGRPCRQSADGGLVAIVSDRAWREYFASAPSVIGKAVTVNGLPATVIGVAPPDSRGTQLAPSEDVCLEGESDGHAETGMIAGEANAEVVANAGRS